MQIRFITLCPDWEMPACCDYQNVSPTAIAEIVKLNTGVMAGKDDGKYTYAARYDDIGNLAGQGPNPIPA